MAVLWSDLTAPQGRIDAAALFGDTDSGEARLTAYLADAAANAGALTGDDLDAFSTHWSYYRAYLAKYEAELGKHAQKQLVNQGSASKLESQITGWLDLANAEKAIADALLPPTVDDVLETAIPPTMSTPVVYGW
jgi:hypothetical protein